MATSMRRRRSSYNVAPRWLNARRVIALAGAAVVLVVGVFATRTVLGLAHLTRQDPLSVVGDLIGGRNGSSISQASTDLRRINVAFYGYGGPGHDGAYLTDSIMVVSIQPRPSGPPAIAEVSVPRDWAVPIQLSSGKTDENRVNQAYADGVGGLGPLPSTDPTAGAAVANQTLEHVLGLHIDHWIGLDFQAFKSAVDAVGGVDVVVQNTFTDRQYPAGECNDQAGSDCSYMTVHFDAGRQHLDGSSALQFARSRHSNDNGEGSDFARSRRQQLVVAALKEKVVSLGGLGHLPDLLNSLGDHVVTDLHVNDLQALYALLKDVDTAKVLHVSLDDTNLLYQCNYPNDCGAAYIYAHDRSYAEVAHFLQNVFVDPAVLAARATVTVQDASGRGQDASSRWAQMLGALSLNTGDGGAVHHSATTHVVDRSGGADAATAAWLAKFFGVSVTTQSPAAAGSSAGGGVLLVLGQDEERAFLGNPGVGR